MTSMTTYERSLQIYQILIAAAHNRQTLTYDMLSKLVGVPRQGLANHLDNIVRFCKARDLPALTVLVVRKRIGKPSHGFQAEDDIDAAREKVYDFGKWYGLKPPAAEDFT